MTSGADRVRARLAAEVPRWFGEGSHLVAVAGPEQRAWSYQFAAEADTPQGRRRLVAKVPRWEEAWELEAALGAGSQEATRREFQALEAIAAAVAARGVEGLVAVPTVGYLPDLNAIVTERLDAVPLRARLGSLPGGEGRVAGLFHLAGRWARLFHDEVSGAGPGRLDGTALGEGLAVMAAALGSRAPEPLRSALAGLEGRARSLDGTPATTAANHGDFNLSNVLVTRDGHVGALDPNLVPGPVLEDLAKLLTDVAARRGRALTLGLAGRGGLASAEAAFLEGYGPADLGLLPFYRAVAAARRWFEVEQRLSGGGFHPAAQAGAVLVRRHLAAEIQRFAAA